MPNGAAQDVTEVKTASLADLDNVLKQTEPILGPLTNVGCDEKESRLTFDTSQNPPAAAAHLILKTDDKTTVPAGKKKICEGTLYVSGKKQSVIAFR